MDRNAQQVKQIRTFVVFQLIVASVFSAVIALILGGVDAELPPWWILAGLYVVLAAAVLNVERSWTRIPPLASDTSGDHAVADSLAAYQRYMARAFLLIEIPLLLSALYAFVTDHGGWPVILVALPTVVALAFETWPSVRNVARIATALEADGASSGLQEAFES
ncbi:hypothetical protein D9V41_04360 [Aeromicrobium phragmitis]|uniref:Uncharacterized protein n=1 Tax=Aeromicrobium phragmitis TaxID=2478914 RepID=A0A3L8PRI5_9ACTN|nr:hypothetical protein [Aeromicrobium phragmitis]RLV56998.1 hypothetical protein D9V41_04360 [Aeromicrobium phragmitis]